MNSAVLPCLYLQVDILLTAYHRLVVVLKNHLLFGGILLALLYLVGHFLGLEVHKTARVFPVFKDMRHGVCRPPALKQAIFNRRAAAREGENTEVGTRFLCLLRMFLSLMPLSLTTELCPVLPNFRKRKTLQSSKKITTLSIPCSLVTDTSYLPSVSTSAISFAVALTIRMPLSLIPSRSASSCRRCVFFSGGVSKRNWSTDIL